jgi:hypothetical protein
MVKVYNRLSVPIEIREDGSSSKATIPALGLADIFCQKDKGCEMWTIVKDGVTFWSGSVPCKISGEIEIDDIPHYGETILPSNLSSNSQPKPSYLWLIVIFALVIALGVYLWNRR